jgi:gas vesicle protein
MDAARVLELVFALSVILAAGLVYAAANRRASRSALVAGTSVLGAAVAGSWVVVAFAPGEDTVLSAAGTTAAFLAGLVALPLRRSLDRNRRLEADAAAVELRMRRRMEELVEENTAELERLVARTRADTISLVGEEERRIAEERRRLIAEQERKASGELAEVLAAVQRRVESRLAAWTEDLDRTLQKLAAEVEKVAERQKVAVADAEARIAIDINRLSVGSEEERAAIGRLREELARAAEQMVAQSTAELESHAQDRRRALHELAERLRRRERELAERIEREEAEAVARITSGLADAERRAVEQLARTNERAATSYADAASAQFLEAIRSAREDAARRLARELDRAVESFTREAQAVLADRLSQIGDAGVKRFERRVTQVAESFERQREELFGGLEERLGATETEIRSRLQTLARDAEAERTVLDGRLQELSHRIDDAVTSARERLARLEELRTR